MKKVISVIACSLVLGLSPVFSQAQNFAVQAGLTPSNASAAAPLPTFDLKFPGGGPTELVKAIEAALGKPLNVIISRQDEDIELPPLKMTGVNVTQLFEALEPMSMKNVTVITGTNYSSERPQLEYNYTATSYGFKTTGNPTENSIWYFHVKTPASPPTLVSSGKVCRFFSLAPYLDRGFTVDDITTAIQKGWAMENASPPELNYHKETKLLIAFGEPEVLKTIDTVLQTLPHSSATRIEIDAMRNQFESMRQTIEDLQAKVKALNPVH